MTRSRCSPFVVLLGWLVAAVVCVDVGAQPATGSPPPLETRSDAPPPPVLEPLPEAASDVELEPQVTIKRRQGETVEEARVNGRLVWIRVTPTHGRPYYLIPTLSGNAYVRRDSLESGLSVPMWVLFTF